MKKKDFQEFASKYLVPKMSGFVVHGDLIYRVPVNVVFRGFMFESSGFNARVFHPNVFVQPLYVPNDQYTWTIGKRLLGNWELQNTDDQTLADRLLESMEKHAKSLLDEFGTPELIAQKVENLQDGLKNHYIRQSAAYSLVWTKKDSEAIQKLDELAVMLLKMSSFQKWALGIHAEVIGLKEILIKDPKEARDQLARWAEDTRRKLDLPK